MFKRFLGDKRGQAAIEFAAVSLIFLEGFLNAVDFCYYEYRRQQVENAAQIAAQTATKTCGYGSLPATTNCSGLNSAITAAIQSTSLGSQVTLASGYPQEAYYCMDSKGVLQKAGTVGDSPTTCASYGNASVGPGDYIQIAVTLPYSPLFPGLTYMGDSSVTSISKTSWMRLE
jgi:Flp pilus assembly protein TadG